MRRYQKAAILRDLEKKMVLLAGPRQAGKTTLAKEIAKEFDRTVYLNYDSVGDRKIIADEAWLSETELVILDEIHKMPGWKNYLKGVYDTKPSHQRILVTGSARLEIFNQVGDSLAGRYFLHRLLPVSLSELRQVKEVGDINRLIARGGFPEPFLASDPTDAKRWRLQYVDSLLHVDVLDFENVHNLNAIRLMFELLRERVGSPISYQSISEDVGISPNTVRKYLMILEALYIVFRVAPFSRNIARSLLKEPKVYFFDTGLVKGDGGIVFENLVAASLLKHVLGRIDYEGDDYALHYLRTKEGKEVDFALVKDKAIEQIVEVKYANHQLGPGLTYFHQKYQLPAVQVVKDLKRQHTVNGIDIVRGEQYLSGLYL